MVDGFRNDILEKSIEEIRSGKQFSFQITVRVTLTINCSLFTVN